MWADWLGYSFCVSIQGKEHVSFCQELLLVAKASDLDTACGLMIKLIEEKVNGSRGNDRVHGAYD